MENVIKIFKALGDYNRLRIIKMLENGELCVCEITDILSLSISSVSKHLSILSNANLIKSRKKGKWVYYRLNEGELPEIQNMLGLTKLLCSNDIIIQQDLSKIKNKFYKLCN